MAINKVVYGGDTLVDLTSDTVTPETLAKGYTAHGANGEPIVGTMANNGAISKTIDGLTTTSAVVPAGYTSGGSVSLTSDIENALAAI